MKKVLVTGANGFIGKYLVNELLEQNYEVYALVHNKNNINLPMHNRLKIIECDMKNYKKLNEFVEDDIDVIYHLAWSGTVGEDRASYEKQLKNVEYSADLLSSAIKMGVKRFLNFGSIIEFEYESTIENKNFAIASNYIYSIAKITTRNILLNIANNSQIDFIPLVLSNVYGPNDTTNRFILNIMRKLLKKEEINLSSCEQFYDFIYVTDAVKSIIEISKVGKKNKFYYIGNKEPKRLKEYVEKINNFIGGESKINYGIIQNNCEIDYKKIDTKCLEDEINYYPKVTFDEGIKFTYEWLKNT